MIYTIDTSARYKNVRNRKLVTFHAICSSFL